MIGPLPPSPCCPAPPTWVASTTALSDALLKSRMATEQPGRSTRCSSCKRAAQRQSGSLVWQLLPRRIRRKWHLRTKHSRAQPQAERRPAPHPQRRWDVCHVAQAVAHGCGIEAGILKGHGHGIALRAEAAFAAHHAGGGSLSERHARTAPSRREPTCRSQHCQVATAAVALGAQTTSAQAVRVACPAHLHPVHAV